LLPVCPPVVAPNFNVAPEANDNVPPAEDLFAVLVLISKVPEVTVRLPPKVILAPNVAVFPDPTLITNVPNAEAGISVVGVIVLPVAV
jgi:hypothetical protein